MLLLFIQVKSLSSKGLKSAKTSQKLTKPCKIRKLTQEAGGEKQDKNSEDNEHEHPVSIKKSSKSK